MAKILRRAKPKPNEMREDCRHRLFQCSFGIFPRSWFFISFWNTDSYLNCLEPRRCFSTSFTNLKVFPSSDLYFKCTFATVLLDDALPLLFTSQPSERNLSRSKEIRDPSPRPLLTCCFSIVRDMQLSVSANVYLTPHNRCRCYVKVTMFTGSVLIGFEGKIA